MQARLTTLIENAAAPRCRALASIDAHLGNLGSDITGTLKQIAEHIREGRYAACARGPFHRRRAG